MAGIAPLFTTAPRIKLKIGGVDIAFAIGMNLNISVDIQPVTVLGKFGPVSLEPTNYNTVSGTLQIIRLISKDDMVTATNMLQDPANGAYVDQTIAPVLADSVNGAGETIQQTSSSVNQFSSNNPLVQNSLIRHMDPRSVLLSTTFDMQMFMRVPDPTKPGVIEALTTGNVAPGVLDVNSADGALIEVPWMTIRQCRLTSRNVNISRSSLINEPVSFVGIYTTTHDVDGNDMMFQDIGPSV